MSAQSLPKSSMFLLFGVGLAVGWLSATALFASSPRVKPFDTYLCRPSAFVVEEPVETRATAMHQCLLMAEQAGKICGIEEPCQ